MNDESNSSSYVPLAAVSALATIIFAALAIRTSGGTSILFLVLTVLAVAGVGAAFGIRARRSGS